MTCVIYVTDEKLKRVIRCIYAIYDDSGVV